MATSLQSLQLDSTGLSSLTGIGDASALVDVDVRFNALEGELSDELVKLTNLETFFCGDNKLFGDLPSFASNKRLTQLRAGGNDFSGRLPSFSVHPRLHTLDLSGNRLAGPIPSDFLAIADTSAAIFLDFSSNRLTGRIPGFLSRFIELTIYATGNLIEGVDPSTCENLRWNDGDVGVFGCDGILCPPRSFSESGRASQDGSRCTSCSSSQTFGSTECGSSGSASLSWRSVHWMLALFGVAVFCM